MANLIFASEYVSKNTGAQMWHVYATRDGKKVANTVNGEATVKNEFYFYEPLKALRFAFLLRKRLEGSFSIPKGVYNKLMAAIKAAKLASCVTIATALFFTIAAAFSGSGAAAAGGAMIGALLGFLIYNANPAKVFMGDTGSLALGGFVTAMAYLLQLPLFIPIVGFIYFIEVVSVIIQVAYFKKTHGKRIFRMAPIHHHFELGGWSEVKVVAVFTIVTVILSSVALLGIWA